MLSGRYDLAFFTYEMFLNLALTSPHLLSRLGLVVLDEGQFITDPRRGITVELILSMLLRARARGISPQFVLLSAVIGQLNGFERWLDIPVLLSRTRPVPQQGLTSASQDLRVCLQGGTAFHNTNLLRPEREAVERGFRSIDGEIYVLASTTTLAAGINTSVDSDLGGERVSRRRRAAVHDRRVQKYGRTCRTVRLQ